MTYIWVYFLVPETRGVALGKEMDEVFGDTLAGAEEECLEITETERTMLLRSGRDGRRRGSLGAYT